MNPASVSTPVVMPKANLNLALVGNCSYGALIDNVGTVKWMCLPRFDGDPTFCSLLRRTNDIGFWEMSIDNFSHSKQYYVKNTGVLKTELHSKNGDALEITDFAPRFLLYGRAYRPQMLIRIVKPIAGHPRIRIRIRPTFGYGWGSPEKTRGTNHIRYLLPNFSVRVTTNAPISFVVDEILFEVDETLHFVMMPDESLKEALPDLVNSNLEKTIEYWLDFSRILSIPFEWQEQVLRSCITVKLCTYEETGAVVAAITSSIPVDNSSPGYDFRFCWLRDSSSIIHTLNKLGSTKTMEDFLKYMSNVVGAAGDLETDIHLQPVYGISLETTLNEKEMHRLAGYRGMGPVRVGTRDFKSIQNDVYGQVILATTQFFFDHRLRNMGDVNLFRRLEKVGEKAIKLYDKPDSGPLGDGDSKSVYTYSAVMCWVAADRLRKISAKLGKEDRTQYWGGHADKIRQLILEKAWNESIGSFTSTLSGSGVDAFLLTLPSVGFISATDPKFTKTLDHIGKTLRKGKYLKNGEKGKNCSTVHTLWYISALSAAGKEEEARDLFENMLKSCNAVGLLGETIDPETGEQWGNFPKTTAMVELIECAVRLSKDWADAI